MTDREGPIMRSIIGWLKLTLPGAVVHHSASEIPLQGRDVARAIAKAKHNGMLVGFPDIIALWHGNLWAFEVKAPGGYPTEAQKAVGENIKRMGGQWAVVRSVDEAAACVAAWMDAAPKAASVELRGTING